VKLPNLRTKIHKHQLLLIAILVFSILTRLWRLNYPSQEYFDEVYHLPAVRLIVNNDPRAYQWWHEPIAEVGNNVNNHDWLHPPLAKLIQAGFIKIFSDTPFAWRLPSALAGVGLVATVYFLAQQIFSQVYASKEKLAKLGLLSAFLTAVSGLVLVQSRIAMNDIFLSLWLCLALLFYWRFYCCWQKTENKNLILTGIFLGLALATKWSAVFLMVFLLSATLLATFKNKKFKILPLSFFSLLLLPVVIYFLSYSQMFFQGKNLQDFAQLHQQIIWYQTHRQEGHAYASTPMQWLLNIRPVWYWQDQQLNISQTANIYALENPVWHLLGLSAVGYFLLFWWKKRFQSRARAKLYLFLLAVYGVVFLPWLVSPRVMFYFHYLPVVPFLAIILAEFLQSAVKKYSKVMYWLAIFLIFAGFLAFYPHWTGLPIANTWAQTVYFAVQSWK
jgi:dolichyl-phosphate-mannose-protein mannosyltransferase